MLASKLMKTHTFHFYFLARVLFVSMALAIVPNLKETGVSRHRGRRALDDQTQSVSLTIVLVSAQFRWSFKSGVCSN